MLAPSFIRKRTGWHGGLRHRPEDDSYLLRQPARLDIVLHARRPVYFADTEMPQIYGHMLLEAFTRLWAIGQVERDMPVVTSVRMNASYAKVFACLGVPAERVVELTRPLIADSAVIPDPAVSRRRWFHPVAFEIFERMKRLQAESSLTPPERIYISRTRVPGRGLRNEAEVEAHFAGLGFAVIHPQELPIEDQIRLYANARMIAASGGSAAHNAVFAPPGAKVLVIASEGWLVNADILMAQEEGRLGYVFGEPVTRPESGHRTQADWTVRLEDVRQATRAHFDLR